MTAKVLAQTWEVFHLSSKANVAFVTGRQIHDESLLQMNVENYWIIKEKEFVAKLDLEKAYDKINWNFWI